MRPVAALDAAEPLQVMARFDDVKATFWDDSDYGVQPPLTQEATRQAERELAVRLPSPLLDLLRVQNGGQVATEWDAFATSRPTSWSEDHVPFTELMGIGRREGMMSLLDTPYLIQEWQMPSPIVLISGDGHCWTGLDYRICGPEGEPSVTWFDNDSNTELALADDLRSFIENLTSSTDFDEDPGGDVVPPEKQQE
ncbi:SMI1/KNR4 family protein [Streptomyces sp. NPDC008141]|uniref:SMI1/KNR4 family protein n=1 Tax=Streptomyces sp. NPDC008141 TaxID=3364815 RepID=UPI0036EBB698